MGGENRPASTSLMALRLLDLSRFESDHHPMSTTIEQITEEALTLPAIDRVHLAETLLQSLEPADEGVEQAWVAEVGRRLERVRDGTAQGRPADEVFRDIRARHQQ